MLRDGVCATFTSSSETINFVLSLKYLDGALPMVSVQLLGSD